MSHLTRTAKQPTVPKESAEETVAAVGKLLDSGEFVAAARMAARGAKQFEEHAWLARANDVLNPRPATVQPARDPNRDRGAELEWLYRHSRAYKGKWVALLEGKLLACAETFADLLAAIPASDRDAHPLIHHVE